MASALISSRTLTKLVVVLTLLVCSSHQVDGKPDKPSILGASSCSSRYTCSTISSEKSRVLPDWERLNCQCDLQCSTYGDCCLDSSTYNAPEARVAVKNWKCLDMVQYRGVYVKASCPSDWKGDPSVVDTCEISSASSSDDPGQEYGPEDPVATAPVTSFSSRITYANYMCAVCHDDLGEDTVLWTPRVECDELVSYNASLVAMSKNETLEDLVVNKLVYEPNKRLWGVKIPKGLDPFFTGKGPLPGTSNSGPGEEEFVACRVVYEMPEGAADLVRRCHPWVDSCPSTWANDTVRSLCADYTAVVFTSTSSQQPYRNLHCAICHQEDVRSLWCEQSVTYRNVMRNSFSSNFAFLFDVNEARGRWVGQVAETCGHHRVYDPFFKVCRDLVCGKPSMVLKGGRCVESTTISNPKANTTTTTTTTRTTTTTTTTPTTTTTTTTTPSTTTPTTEPPPTILPSNITTESPTNVTRTTTSSTTAATTSSTMPPTTESTTTSSTTSATTTTTSQTVATEGPIANLTECAKFAIGTGDFSMLPNGSMFIERYNKMFDTGTFLVSGDTVLVCSEDAIDDGTEQDGAYYLAKFSPVLGYVSIGGLGVSLICLSLHLLAFMCVPQRRNLSAKNLASLCVALSAAFATFVAAAFEGPGIDEDDLGSSRGCVVIAVVMYFSFLAAFFWMNAIAFDVWRTLRLATTELRVSGGRQWRRFVAYSAYSWLGPACIVAAAVAVDNSQEAISEDYRPAFGLRVCWFSSRRGLLLFFVAPVAIMLAVNVALFTMSAYIILRSTNSSAAKLSGSKARRNFRLYLRLALIMGLTWIMGVVAGQIDSEPIWYAFVILNTLQGLFIFVSFTCTVKVRAWVSACCSCSSMVREGPGGRDRRHHNRRKGVDGSAPYYGDNMASSTRKFGLESRDSGSSESQTSQSSRTSLTRPSITSLDTLY